MVRKFDKKNATTYSVVHRAHDDARYFEEDASNVLVPTAQTSRSTKKKVFTKHDLENKLKDKLRANEGMAAQYGITFDDSNYDYMQHLKPIGKSEDGVFIQAKGGPKVKQMSLEEALREQLPSDEKRKVARDLNQSIPDELKGFQPDMDPRLREVLEALDDEAYIEDVKVRARPGNHNDDDEEGEEYDDDVFADLLKSGEVEDEDEFYGDGEEYDEWDLDNYGDEYGVNYEQPQELEGNDNVNANWQQEFAQFKKETKNRENEWDSDDDFDNEEEEEEEETEETGDTLGELPNVKGSSKSKTKLRKKKGAMTDTSSFSMSSSALYRTEGLSLLDDRYEQLHKKYTNNDEAKANASASHKTFNMKEERNDFEGMLDDFLDNYELESGGRKLAKKDQEKAKLQAAANSVSRGKRAQKMNSAFERLQIE
ncbi:uncharacterized protein LODBEIA_P20310 [Lodderomyces beijingensis]|uniref:Low temperature viability protein n=1 Tax=Lodderomyces beijingensis TaxID=1775926 RepID=A0ABP0ZK63_9ASCO